jgi:ATP-dependent RNA helicase HelY
VTASRSVLTLGTADFPIPPKPLARIDLPEPYEPHRSDYQREVARRLVRARLGGGRQPRRPVPAVDHPVLADPDLTARLKAATAAERIGREVEELTLRVRGRGQTLARRFDRVLALLEDWRYVDRWRLTPAGERLARLFHECDLLVAECLEQGLLDGLEPAALAGLVSVFTYEHRSAEAPPAPWFPSAEVRRRYREIEAVARALNGKEEEAALDLTRSPDPTFVAVAYAWAAGEAFAEVVEAEELSGGDFVRNVKQLIDLLRQLAQLAPQAATRAAAAGAVELLFRGVIEASSRVVDEDDGHEPDGDEPDGDEPDGEEDGPRDPDPGAATGRA